MANRSVPLILAGGGAIFVWSGIKGYSVSQLLRNVLSGKAVTGLSQDYAITGTANPGVTAQPSAGVTGGTATGQEIANTALQFKGHAYLYGGAPGPNAANPWDCSSFCNYVFATKLNLAIPGGKYDPNTHGPATTSWLSFGTGIQASAVAAGDICVCDTHMGIAINNTQMISPLNPSLGTEVTGITDGMPSGETVYYRRCDQ